MLREALVLAAVVVWAGRAVARDDASAASEWSNAARRNHGPGTSGGGASTPSGETLKKGSFEVDLRLDYTKFEDVSREEAEERALASGGFDALDQSLLTTASLSYGITDDFQVGVQIGYYSGDNFVDAEADAGEVESGIADPEGITDTWITGKYRVYRGPIGQLALMAGVKAPTGRDDVRLDNGEKLEPSSQPGSGAWDFQLGVGFSRYLAERITTDAGAAYTVRTEHNDFRVGDRFDAGVAVAYRFTGQVTEFPNFSAFAEALVVWLDKDESAGVDNDNSGGTTLYLSPGVRVRITEGAAITASLAFPVVQDLNGDQIESEFKASAALSLSF